jgi:hypothetical protein
MPTKKKMTVSLDPDLIRELKHYVLDNDLQLNEVVSQSLRLFLAPKVSSK